MSADLLIRFRDAVRRDPGRVAVRDLAGTLTFAELDERAALLAGALAERGIGRGDLVGVSLPRSTGLVVALLAAWRSGAAYVPLDPSYPGDRLAFMSGDAGIKALLAASAPGWLPPGVAVVTPGTQGQALEAGPGQGSDPGYVIYTSGSTGRPKGVLVQRAAIAELVTALERAGMYDAAPRVVGWNASVSFDASVQQWARVCRGDTIVVLDQDHRTCPERLAAWLTECAVTDLDMTPSHWAAVREPLLAAGRRMRLFIGGEPISEPMWRELAAATAAGKIEAINLYGPTECTVDATATWIRDPGGPHIGLPLTGIGAHLLDDMLRPVPPGAVGQLYLSGSRLAAGYLGRGGLTADRFVAGLSGQPGTRMYRTGDAARLRADGVLEFVGRADRQVKLRGFRVELGEVEAALCACAGVTAGAVLLRDDSAAGQQLVAYHVSGATADSLRTALAATLPEFMIPAVFVRLDALPLTPNGKLDAAALPAPCDAAGAAGAAYSADPAGEFEELIAAVWADVLGRDKISADDDFFALGGHSLVALRVVARLKKNFGLAMSAKDVYRHPRLLDLARHVETLASAAAE